LLSWRNVALVVFFVGLAALEIAHGIFRLDTIHASRRGELLDTVERGHAELARGLRTRYDEGRQHAAYLARSPAVRALLARPAPSPAEHAELASAALPYLVSFRGIDRVRVLDAGGIERFRGERIGQGVGSLPEALLAGAPDAAMLALADARAPGEVVVSGLFLDEARVEVSESDRQVLHYVAPVAPDPPRSSAPSSSAGERAGLVVLTAYAAPLFNAVRRFEPVAGVSAALVDGSGTLVSGGAGAGHAEGARALFESGASRLETEGALLLAERVNEVPPSLLVTIVPEAALEAAMGPLRGEYVWVVASMVAITLVLAGAGAFFLRLSVRAFHAREAERYLARIRRESEKYRALLEGAADMILIVDPRDESVRESNRVARDTLGLALEPAEHARARLSELFSGQALASLREALQRASQEPGRALAVPEIRVRGAEGRELVADGRLAGIELEGERIVQISLRDLTRQKEIERQLQIAERLSSLGLLTAGVAHEINNPLEGIGNYLALLERGGASDDGRKRQLEAVRHGFQRIRDIVRDLSSFARPGIGQGTADLAQVVERALKMVRYSKQLGEVELEVRGLERPVQVAGDAGRLEQVLLNLVLNAASAMGSRGKITITARGAPDSEAGSAAREVELLVEDEGPGIPEEHLGRIFDPFFTTGEKSGGTGLGLAVTYGIVRAHGGTLAARNREGGGAQFAIRLPRPRPAPEAPARVRGTSP